MSQLRIEVLETQTYLSKQIESLRLLRSQTIDDKNT